MCRPHAECGARAGETVPGGEAHGSGGAADDVRARAGVASATAVSRENAAEPPQQQRPPRVPDEHVTQQTADMDGGAVSGALDAQSLMHILDSAMRPALYYRLSLALNSSVYAGQHVRARCAHS